MALPLLVVDGANVVGSVPDGWWKDRAGAAVRLRDRLLRITGTGVADVPGPVEVVLVVEGRARDIPAAEGVQLVRAPGSGDDAIVQVVASHASEISDGRTVVVVTADRELRERVRALGATVIGPSSIPR
jgi:hypothetical protein